MRVLWIPIFSMRSYDTGKYAILKDGNFQLTLARASASDFDSITIAIPRDASDTEELLGKYGDRFTFKEMDYGMNAVETREQFWIRNSMEMEFAGAWFDLLISDITGYTKNLPVIYNFNITKLPELNRPYIDKFFETDLKSIEQSLFTTVINPRQREYILEVRPDLLDKVIVNTLCAAEVNLPVAIVQLASSNMIFWPFRISDKAYEFEQFLEAFEAQGLADQFHIVITDPNDTYKGTKSYISKIKPTKEQFNAILSSRPIIVMLDDMDTVLHPGTIELFFYKCPVITYEADIIENPNSIRDLNELSTRLSNLSYNVIDMSSFVYGRNSLDPFYNQEFVSVRQN